MVPSKSLLMNTILNLLMKLQSEMILSSLTLILGLLICESYHSIHLCPSNKLMNWDYIAGFFHPSFRNNHNETIASIIQKKQE